MARPMFVIDLLVRNYPTSCLLCFSETRGRAHNLADLFNLIIPKPEQPLVKAVSACLPVSERDCIIESLGAGKLGVGAGWCRYLGYTENRTNQEQSKKQLKFLLKLKNNGQRSN